MAFGLEMQEEENLGNSLILYDWRVSRGHTGFLAPYPYEACELKTVKRQLDAHYVAPRN